MGAPWSEDAPCRCEADVPSWLGSKTAARPDSSCSEPGSLTGQKAEPVGMKLTLFLSGQEKRGADGVADCLELQSGTGRVRDPVEETD